MSKFSDTRRRPLRTNLTAPVRTTGRPTLTHEGGLAHVRDAESELFLLAATNMVGEDTFYEHAPGRDARFVDLVRYVTAANPAFVARLAPYLRTALLMRSAAVVMAAEYVAAGGPHGRAVVDGVLQRADEPAELIGYWLTSHGRNRPWPSSAAWPTPPDGSTPSGPRSLRRPVPTRPHGRRDRAHPSPATRRPPVGALPLAARPSPP